MCGKNKKVCCQQLWTGIERRRNVVSDSSSESSFAASIIRESVVARKEKSKRAWFSRRKNQN